MGNKTASLCRQWNSHFLAHENKTEPLSHIADYWILTTHEFNQIVKGPSLWSRVGKLEQHITDCVLSISNFWFVLNQQKAKTVCETKPKDFHASLKLASTTFNSENAKPAVLEGGKQLFFDKGGLIVPLAALQALMSDASFIAFVQKIHERMELDQGNQINYTFLLILNEF